MKCLLGAVAAPLILFTAACTGTVGTGSNPGSDEGSQGGGDDGAQGGAGGADNTGPVQIPAADECAERDTIEVGPTSIARLSNTQYQRTVADLMTGFGGPSVELPKENASHGFLNNAESQTPSFTLVESLMNGAQSVAELTAGDITRMAPCSGSDDSALRTCGHDFVERFGKQAFRRPLEDDERGRFVQFFDDSLSEHGYDFAVEMSVQAFLQSPQFLYRIEFGRPLPDNPDVSRLTDHELASRLSYFLTGSMPDRQLMAAADNGELSDAGQLAAHAQRLLDRDVAGETVAEFHAQWLELGHAAEHAKDSEVYPQWNATVETELQHATEQFVDHVFWEQGGELSALLQSQTAFVNNETAWIYGLDAGGDELMPVDTGDRRAAGLLTQAGWLAATGGRVSDSPVKRGIFIRERLLCSAPPPPPPDVMDSLEDSRQQDEPQTTRQVLEARHHVGSCGACHRLFDGLGFALGNFDSVGAWRDEENGVPIDATGVFDGFESSIQDTEFDGAIEMASALVGADELKTCVSTQWFRFALARTETKQDACNIRRLADALNQPGGDMHALIANLVASDAFVHRDTVNAQ